ncbi:hypothetical protein VF05_10685, partial [Nostoc linckia z3]
LAKPKDTALASDWQDLLKSVGLEDVGLAKPKDTALASDWQDLLKSVGLEDVASETITQCCTPMKAGGQGAGGRGKEQSR